MTRSNYFLSIFTILFSVFFLYMTSRIPQSSSTYIIGPKTWPIILLTLMLVLGIIMFIKTYFQAKKDVEDVVSEEKEPVKKVFNVHASIIVAVIVGIYLFLLNTLGFILSSLLFIFVVSLLLGIKRKTHSILLSVIGTAALVYLFCILLGIPLPRGIGIFRDLSLLFY
ncbi:tripartite tricarboxylate transporter TctB family protein [Oceanobacillus kapialis]|uniref:tripartite tricarboxylate transporter TctB family protein n=1 Tax=Oceanobacillus kapialis TaxID=481353 RepID=UPI0038503F36